MHNATTALPEKPPLAMLFDKLACQLTGLPDHHHLHRLWTLTSLGCDLCMHVSARLKVLASA